MNYIVVEDIVLLRACESVTIDMMTSNDQIGKKNLQRVEEKLKSFID